MAVKSWENSCSANTDSRKTGDILDILNSGLQNITFPGLVTWYELKIVPEQNKSTQKKQTS